MSLLTTIRAGIGYEKTGGADLAVNTGKLVAASDQVLKNGTAASKADLAFSDTRALSGSANEDLDLAGGLTDELGATLTFVKIKAIMIEAPSSNGNTINVGPASSNGFTGPFADASDRIKVAPGGRLVLTAPVNGWAVTAGTGDLLNIANADGSAATYKITIIGTSA